MLSTNRELEVLTRTPAIKSRKRRNISHINLEKPSSTELSSFLCQHLFQVDKTSWLDEFVDRQTVLADRVISVFWTLLFSPLPMIGAYY